MKFWEAMKAYEEGKKVRCKKWDNFHFMWNQQDNTSIMDRQQLWFYLDEEWEIYIDLSKIHAFSAVIKGLLDGKEYRRPSWRKDRKPIWMFGGEGELIGKIKGEDLIADDWIEVSDE